MMTKQHQAFTKDCDDVKIQDNVLQALLSCNVADAKEEDSQSSESSSSSDSSNDSNSDSATETSHADSSGADSQQLFNDISHRM